ncbi:MAG: phosphomannomutase/phosphoglucomutase [Mogibacterium sp.]|nr:phosphomannomutase/phosphoglucomutase [Mogibacterium sp.]
MARDFSKLQNGSDIRGVAIEGVPGEPVNLTEEFAAAVGAAFTYWLAQRVRKNVFDLKICVGSDPRLSADTLKQGLAKGVCYLGSRVYDAGTASTPAMFMSTVMPYYDFDGAVMITASHLPYNRNGFKFFTAGGGLDKEDIKAILDKAATLYIMPEYYEMEPVNVMDMYAAHLRMLLSAKGGGDLRGLKVVVDAGNGAGGFFAKDVLARLGADVSGSQFLEPDGSFPNHQPNPENKDAMAAITSRVLETGADLGIIFDTDVDRSAAVAPDGKPISRNEIVALAAALVAADHPGGTVVTDSITSTELAAFLKDELGLKHLRYRRGYRNVINKAMELAAEGEDAFLAIETSGHAAYADNYYLDDGAYLAVLIVAAAARLKREGKTVGDLISGLGSPAEAIEYRMDILAEDFGSVGDRVLGGLPDYIKEMNGRSIRFGDVTKKYRLDLSLEEPNYEGVRVNYRIVELSNEAESYSGWFLLRKSLHDPVLPLNIESSTLHGAAMIAPVIRLYMRKFPEVTEF